LRRAVDAGGFDPQSGFSVREIVDFVRNLPEVGNAEQLAQANAVLRRNGFAN